MRILAENERIDFARQDQTPINEYRLPITYGTYWFLSGCRRQFAQEGNPFSVVKDKPCRQKDQAHEYQDLPKLMDHEKNDTIR